jgi:hypothetical protein
MTKIQQRVCSICGNHFTHQTQRGRPPATCSAGCKAQLRTTTARVCTLATCKAPFDLHDDESAPPYFCCKEHQALNKQHQALCAHCRLPMPPEMADINKNNFCSLKCIKTASSEIGCRNCGQPVAVYQDPPWYRVQKFCKPACRESWLISTGVTGTVRERRSEDESVTELPDFEKELLNRNSGKRIDHLPDHGNGNPYRKVIPPPQITKRLSPKLRKGIEFRKSQLERLADGPRAERGLRIHLAGAQVYRHPTFSYDVAPSHPHYLPSLAQVYPFLEPHHHRILAGVKWEPIQRMLSRSWNRWTPDVAGKLEFELNAARERQLTGDHQPPTKAQKAHPHSILTQKMVQMYEISRDLNRHLLPRNYEYLPTSLLPRLQWADPPFGERGDLLQFINDELQAYRQWIEANDYATPDEIIPPDGLERWRYMLQSKQIVGPNGTKYSIDAPQFAQWLVYGAGIKQDGTAKPWTYGGAEFNPDADC